MRGTNPQLVLVDIPQCHEEPCLDVEGLSFGEVIDEDVCVDNEAGTSKHLSLAFIAWNEAARRELAALYLRVAHVGEAVLPGDALDEGERLM